jgi:hypothetical protein
MHPIDYSQHCTKIWDDPAVNAAPYGVIFMHHRSVQSCAARGRTKRTLFQGDYQTRVRRQ